MPLVAPRARPGGAAHFAYSEFPGWETATRDQLDGLDLLAPSILEPARVGTGLRFYVTSWLRPRQGTSAHPFGTAVDFAAGPDRAGAPATKADTFNAWLWIAQNIPDRVGELIYEQPRTGSTGHVHVTARGYGGVREIMYQNEAGRLLVLDPFSLTVSGELPPGRSGEPGSETNPYELPGLTVTVSRYPWLPWFLGAAGVAWLLTRRRG